MFLVAMVVATRARMALNSKVLMLKPQHIRTACFVKVLPSWTALKPLALPELFSRDFFLYVVVLQERSKRADSSNVGITGF